jgi:hypothetical protein
LQVAYTKAVSARTARQGKAFVAEARTEPGTTIANIVNRPLLATAGWRFS